MQYKSMTKITDCPDVQDLSAASGRQVTNLQHLVCFIKDKDLDG